jgi:DNA-binding MarR family transcriptional regulator
VNDALFFIAAHIEREGYAPTVREIAAAMGVAPSAALATVEQLEKDGFIERPKGPSGVAIARAMRLTRAAAAA